MVKVTVGNNLVKNDVIVDASTTLRIILEDAGIDYTTGSMHLDGCALMPGDIDKTLGDFNVTERCFLLNVVKADNGVL
jgi:hypothetical protein